MKGVVVQIAEDWLRILGQKRKFTAKEKILIIEFATAVDELIDPEEESTE